MREFFVPTQKQDNKPSYTGAVIYCLYLRMWKSHMNNVKHQLNNNKTVSEIWSYESVS
jgi:hypothetical protein